VNHWHCDTNGIGDHPTLSDITLGTVAGLRAGMCGWLADDPAKTAVG